MAFLTGYKETVIIFDNTADSFLSELDLCQSVSDSMIRHLAMTAIRSDLRSGKSLHHTLDRKSVV